MDKAKEADPLQLGLMRIDLTAEVLGVLVSWFARKTRAKEKQWAAKIREIEYAEIGRPK